MRKRLFEETSFPRLIAHRGFTPLAPENSLFAFEVAGRLGFWAIESDVHETRDGLLSQSGYGRPFQRRALHRGEYACRTAPPPFHFRKPG